MEIATQSLGIGSRVKHPAYGDGVIIRLNVASYEVCFFTYGIKHVGREYDKWEVIEAIQAEEEVSFTAAEQSLIKILKTWSDATEIVELGDKWKNGIMILKPFDDSVKPKEIPIDTFFIKS